MNVLVLGAGAVGTVSALKFAQHPMVTRLVIADAVPGRAQLLADRIGSPRVSAMTLNAGNCSELARTIRETGTTILLNAALPATNLVVMRACLDGGCDYLDMASGGAAMDGTPKLPDQFALDQEFKAAGRLAILGMGADPGTSNVYAAYAAKHLLDTVTELLLVSPLTARLYVVPLPVTTTLAVAGTTVTSELVKSVTASLKTAVKLTGDEAAGSAWPAAWSTVTDGWELCTVTLALEADAVQLAESAVTT